MDTTTTQQDRDDNRANERIAVRERASEILRQQRSDSDMFTMLEATQRARAELGLPSLKI